MKKLFTFIFIAILFAGCYTKESDTPASIDFSANTVKLDSIRANDSNEVVIEHLKLTSHKLDEDGHIIQNYSRYLRIYKFKYDGHRYIMFRAGGDENGVVHDPNCECFNK
jgi:hypothetical protein